MEKDAHSDEEDDQRCFFTPGLSARIQIHVGDLDDFCRNIRRLEFKTSACLS
jgi:hypothetical protein